MIGSKQHYKNPDMKASEAYDYVLNQYQIKAKDIAVATGKSEADISKFRNGKRNISVPLFISVASAILVRLVARNSSTVILQKFPISNN